MIHDADSSADNVTPLVPSRVDFGLSRDPWDRLRLIDGDGRCYEQVTVVPLFPITDPEHWITICDAQGHELVCIDDLAVLSPDTLSVLQDELSRREFLPSIQRIVRVSGNTEPSQWDVETDRGPTHFVLETEENVRRLGRAKLPSPIRMAFATWCRM